MARTNVAQLACRFEYRRRTPFVVAMRGRNAAVVQRFPRMPAVGRRCRTLAVGHVCRQVIDACGKYAAARIFAAFQRIAIHFHRKAAHGVRLVQVVAKLRRAVLQHQPQWFFSFKVGLQRVHQLFHRDLLLVKYKLFDRHQRIAHCDGGHAQRRCKVVHRAAALKVHTALDAAFYHNGTERKRAVHLVPYINDPVVLHKRIGEIEHLFPVRFFHVFNRFERRRVTRLRAHLHACQYALAVVHRQLKALGQVDMPAVSPAVCLSFNDRFTAAKEAEVVHFLFRRSNPAHSLGDQHVIVNFYFIDARLHAHSRLVNQPL